MAPSSGYSSDMQVPTHPYIHVYHMHGGQKTEREMENHVITEFKKTFLLHTTQIDLTHLTFFYFILFSLTFIKLLRKWFPVCKQGGGKQQAAMQKNKLNSSAIWKRFKYVSLKLPFGCNAITI